MISPQAEILAVVTKVRVRSIVFINRPSFKVPVLLSPEVFRPSIRFRYWSTTAVYHVHKHAFVDCKRDIGFSVELEPVTVRGGGNFFEKKNALGYVLGCGEFS